MLPAHSPNIPRPFTAYEYVHPAGGTPEPISGALADEIEHARQGILQRAHASLTETLGEPDHVNLPRMEHFMNALELPRRRYISTGPIDSALFSESFGQACGVPNINLKFDSNQLAFYANALQIAFLTRHSRNQSTCEKTAMHEWGGHSGELEVVRVRTKDPAQLNFRNMLTVHGGWQNKPVSLVENFLDEGTAELIAGAYAEHYKVGDELAQNFLPAKYLMRPEGALDAWFKRPTSATGALSAVVLEMLMERDPGLAAAAFHGASDPEAQRIFKERTDRLSPGLFECLNAVDTSKTASMRDAGLHVANVLFNGDTSVIGRVGQDVTRDYVKNKLAAYEASTGQTFPAEKTSALQTMRQAFRLTFVPGTRLS